MNVKRQYSLPNCNLILEGIEDIDGENADILSGQPPMSVLLNAECHLLKSDQKLSGGSVFLANLSQAVSDYAQSFLSGLTQSEHKSAEYPQVSMNKLEQQHLHRLTLEPQPDDGKAKTEIDITTVELFDLVDAIDQFYADQSTMPDMVLRLKSVSKRYRKPEQPLAERLTPVAIGFTSLAFAAGALFMIPPPEIMPPETVSPSPTTESDTQSTPKPDSNQDN